MPRVSTAYSRCLPSTRTAASPAVLSTLRCCETAGRLTFMPSAISVTERVPSRRRLNTKRRVGSPNASSVRSALIIAKLLVVDPHTNRKYQLTRCQDYALRRGRSVAKHRQFDLPKARGIGNDVDLGDFSAPDLEIEHDHRPRGATTIPTAPLTSAGCENSRALRKPAPPWPRPKHRVRAVARLPA